jgi:hypothetical protein
MLTELKNALVTDSITEEQIEAIYNTIDVDAIEAELDSIFVLKIWDRKERLNDVDPQVFIDHFGIAPEAFVYIIQNREGHTDSFQPFVPHVQGINLMLSEEQALEYGLAEKTEKIRQLLFTELHKIILAKLEE